MDRFEHALRQSSEFDRINGVLRDHKEPTPRILAKNLCSNCGEVLVDPEFCRHCGHRVLK